MASNKLRFIMSLLTITIPFLGRVETQGRLVEPPQRSSLWREGHNVPVNLKDNYLDCGGRQNLIFNKGMCGTCGDPYEGERHHEAGGKYASGIMVRHYPANTTRIQIAIELNLFHRGYFEFRVCANNDVNRTVEPMCLNENLLQIAETNDSRYYPTAFGTYNLTLQLPDDLHCDQCVLQWKYRGSNFLGLCEDGTESLGCGHQVEYYNCADIAIDSPFPENSTPKDNLSDFVAFNPHQGDILHTERSFDYNFPTNFFTIIMSQRSPKRKTSISSLQDQTSTDAVTNVLRDQTTKSPDFHVSSSTFKLTTASPFLDLGVSTCLETDTWKCPGDGVTSLRSPVDEITLTSPSPIIRENPLEPKINENTTTTTSAATSMTSNDTPKTQTSESLITIPADSVTFPNTVANSLTLENNPDVMTDSVKFGCLPGRSCPPHGLLCVKRLNCTISLGGRRFCTPIWDCPLSSTELPNLSMCFGHGKYLKCEGRGIYRQFKSISTWCEHQCANNACQLDVCNCQCHENVTLRECQATGIFQTVPGADIWCKVNCAQNFCPATHCNCY